VTSSGGVGTIDQVDPALPPGCILRPARAEDQAAIRALVRVAQLDPTQLRWAQFWVVEHGGQVVACGQLRRFRGAQELGSLVVAPAWQRHGLGAVLVRRLVREATLPLYLECRAGLAPYYARFGFVRVSWRAVPGPLRFKFGLSTLVSRLFRQPVVSMRYPRPPAHPPSQGGV
jgi:amino-acid N-acetyltransferase